MRFCVTLFIVILLEHYYFFIRMKQNADQTNECERTRRPFIEASDSFMFLSARLLAWARIMELFGINSDRNCSIIP